MIKWIKKFFKHKSDYRETPGPIIRPIFKKVTHGQKLINRTITGQNQFTDPAEIQGYFNISISGTWAGTITVQRSFDGGSTWLDVNSWVANAEEYGLEPESGVWYRIGIKIGDYASGNAVARLSQ